MITIKNLREGIALYGNKTVEVCGWARSVREGKSMGFIDLNDGSAMAGAQVVFERDKLAGGEQLKLTTGCAVSVKGLIVPTPQAQQPFEIRAEEIGLLGECPVDYPLQKKRHSFEYLRTQLHLRTRTNTFYAVFRVRSLAAHAIHEFFAKEGFVLAHTPIITGSDCEGAGEMFRVTTLPLGDEPRSDDGKVDFEQDFFKRETNLTVSGQLYAECFALSFGKTYTFGPTFRAERSNTARHAAEFWMIEPEMAFAGLEEDMELAEKLIKYVIGYVLREAPDEMQFFNKFVDQGLLERLNNVSANEFARVTYTQAVDILINCGEQFEYPVKWGCDLQTEHERYLTERHFLRPVFVTDYPREIKAFYMRDNGDGTVAAMDCLVPGVGEIVGGSQREERLSVLQARVGELGFDMADYWWYLELRKYGGVQHAGFGLGFERLVMYLTGMSNIRDVLAFPRTCGEAGF